MANTAKLTMLMKLSDKMFNSKLAKMQSKFGRTMNNMKMKFRSFSSEIPGMNRGMDLLTNKWVLMGAAVAGFALMTNKSISATQRFDEAFLPIRQLNLDKSKAEMDNYRSQIRDASFEMGMNLSDSTNAIYELQSGIGVYGDDAISIYKKVAGYSYATGANLTDSMNSTVKAMKAFGMGVEDIDKLLASNAKTVQVGITTFDELAKVQTEYAGAASSAGQDIDRGNKVFAMFTSIAKSSDIAANMTKTFFQGLGQQGKKIEKVLDIKVFDKGMARDADAILKDIGNKFKTMNDQQITDTINKIGGPDGLRGALKKVKTGADDMIATFNAFDSSSFSLEEAIKNADGDYSKMKEMFFNRVDIIMTKFGEKIMPMIAGFFDMMTPVLDWLYKNIDWLIPVLGSFVGVLGTITAATWLWNIAMMANPIGLIIAAVAGLIAGIVVLINSIDGWGKQ